MRPIKIIKYETAVEIEYAFRTYIIGDVEDDTEWALMGTAPDGEEMEMSPEDVVTQIKEQGLWCFSNVKRREIHTWWTFETPPVFRFQALAHELGHILQEDANPLSDPDAGWPEDLREEQEAESFSEFLVELAQIAELVDAPN